MGGPWSFLPDLPADRLKILRDAWNITLKDPELLAKAKKRGCLVGPVAGEDLDSLGKEVIAQSADVIMLKKLLGE